MYDTPFIFSLVSKKKAGGEHGNDNNLHIMT